jgi:hypothetical protein
VPAAAGIARPVLAGAALADPVYAAIAAHECEFAALEEACRELSRLEQAIPAARRQAYFPDEEGPEVGANDDPRWTAGLAAYLAAAEAETRAAWALAHVSPATVAGAAALLRHAHAFERRGCEWPGEPETGDGDDWTGAFHGSIAAALAALA